MYNFTYSNNNNNINMRKKEIKDQFNTLINAYERKIKELEDKIALMRIEHNRLYSDQAAILAFERMYPTITLPSGKQINVEFLNEEQLEYLESLGNYKQK